MSFSFRIAKGLRIRVSNRGVRTSIGPRGARLHFGSGSPGVSTGVGPFGFYQSLGAGRRGGRTTPPPYSSHLEKLVEAQEAYESFEAIEHLHRGDFRPAERPIAPPPRPVDTEQVRERHEAAALAGIGFFRRGARRAAKERAAATAADEIARQEREAEDERIVLQAQLDDRWQRLLDNDPEIVLSTLEAAFEDNQAPAGAVGVDGNELDVVVVVPPVEVIPDRAPTTTPAGNPSLRKLSKSERSGFYADLVCGHLLATIREAFAVAPAIASARSAVLRFSAPDSYGKRHLDCLLAASFARKAFDGVLWDTTDALQIVGDTSTEQLFKLSGRTKEFEALDLSGEPELAALVEQVDLSEVVD